MSLEAPLDLVRDPQLLAHPQRHGRLERAEALGPTRRWVLQQPHERGERLVVVDDGVEPVGPTPPRFRQYAMAFGELGVVLDAGEALLLGRRHELAVDDQRGRGVVVEGADPEDVHWLRRPSARRSCAGAGATRATRPGDDPGAVFVRVDEVPHDRRRRRIECVAEVDVRGALQEGARVLRSCGIPARRFVGVEAAGTSPRRGAALLVNALGLVEEQTRRHRPSLSTRAVATSRPAPDRDHVPAASVISSGVVSRRPVCSTPLANSTFGVVGARDQSCNASYTSLETLWSQ